jgi:hypothetical protein
MEGGDAPAFDLGNVNRHDFGSYQIEQHKGAVRLEGSASIAVAPLVVVAPFRKS